MKFTKVTAFGSAGGISRTGKVTLTIEATECDTVAELRDLVEAAPHMREELLAIDNTPGLLARVKADVQRLTDWAEADAQASAECGAKAQASDDRARANHLRRVQAALQNVESR